MPSALSAPALPRLLLLLLVCCGGAAPFLAAQEAGAPPEPSAPAAARELRWRWQPGKTYRFQTETETIMSLEALGREGEQILQVIQNTEIAVRPRGEGGAKNLVVRFLTLRARLAAGGRTFLYDSEEPSESDPALRSMLADSSGREFTLVYSADDRFVELGAVDQPAARPGQVPSLLAVADARQVAELYRRSLEMALPRAEVAAGDKWISSEQVAFPQAGDMEVRMNCHYQENLDRGGRPHAKLTFQGRLSQDAARVAVGAITLGGDSTLAGQIFFDLERDAISLSMFLGSLVIVHEGQNLPVRHSVTTRLEDIVDSAE